MYPNQSYNSPQTISGQKRPAAKAIFVSMIVAGVFLVIGIGVWIYCESKSSSDTGKTEPEMAALLDTADSSPLPQKVDSDLGMVVSYNARELAAYGFADGTTFSGNDLAEKRDYGVVRVRPVETNQAARSEMTLVSPELRVTSTNDKNYWEKLNAKEGYKELSKIDALVKANSDQRTIDNQFLEVGDSKEQKFGDITYKKVAYTNKDERYGVTSVRREDCYFTVQNDRPYIACIDNIRASNFAVASQLEQVVAALTYTKPNQDSLISADSKVEDEVMTNNTNESVAESDSANSQSTSESEENTSDDSSQNADDSGEGSNSNNSQKSTVSDYLASTKDFSTFAGMIPATVRTGLLYCADIKLSMPDGKPGPQLTGACVEKSGSGFFVSTDGMVATAASNINVTPREAIRAYITNSSDSEQASSRLDTVLQYMLEAKLLMQTDIDAITAGLSERNQDVIEKIHVLADMINTDDISIARESYSYAVQTSNKPIVVNKKNDGNLEFAYSDDVLEAELIGKKYDNEKTQSDIAKGDNLKHDAGLLKVKESRTYPIIPLAASSSVQKGGVIDVVGAPMYAVGTLTSGQLRPSAMLKQGKSEQIFGGSDGQRLLVITTPLHPGLIGAPATNMEGQAVGVAAYSTAQCPGASCLASVVVRDIAEIKSLAKDNNKSISSSSSVSDVWHSAIKELVRGNYKTAAAQFNQAASQYPQNYLASSFAQYAKSRVGSATDTSNMNLGVSAAKVTVVVSAIVLVLLMITRLAIRLFARPTIVSQYGNMSGDKYIDPRSWQAQSQARPNPSNQPITPTQQPAQQVYSQQPYYGQVNNQSPVQPYQQPGYGQGQQPPVGQPNQPQNYQDGQNQYPPSGNFR